MANYIVVVWFQNCINFDCLRETRTACDLGMHTGQHAAPVSHDADVSERKIDQILNQPFCIEQLKTVILRNTGCTE